MKHTPLSTADKLMLGDIFKGEQYEFIVHAVNMHELLLATLKQAVESLDEFGCEDIVYYKDIIKKAERK